METPAPEGEAMTAPSLLAEARRLMPGLEWREWQGPACVAVALRGGIGSPWASYARVWIVSREGVWTFRATLRSGVIWHGSGPAPESALLDLRAQVERYLSGRNRPPQRRADCERWLAAWRTT
jgi:hypothetical protein